MYRIGIDLGGTNIVAGVVDENYQIVASAKCKTRMPRPAAEIVADMGRMAEEAVKRAGLTHDAIAYVGIGSPGTCNAANGVVEFANNLGFSNVPVCAMLKEQLHWDVFVGNDADCAALGEVKAGAAKGAVSCVCVTLGTGVGSGIIINGKIFNGFNFAGGEIGHTVIHVDGESCSCGRNGCWEAYASATALIRQTRRAMEAHPESAMWQIAGAIDRVDGRTAFDAMRQNDPAGRAVVDAYIAYIGCGLVNVINIFQPEVLCIGGGICKEGATLIKPLQAYIEKERYSKNAIHQTRLCTAQLGNDAGIIGAACLGER